MEIVLVFSILLIVVFLIIPFKSIAIVPDQKVFIVERLGRYHRSLVAGFNVMLPILDRVACKMPLNDQVLKIDDLTLKSDNSAQNSIRPTCKLIYRIIDPVKAAYNVENYVEALKMVVSTFIKNVVGEMELSESGINNNAPFIKEKIKENARDTFESWGLDFVDFHMSIQ